MTTLSICDAAELAKPLPRPVRVPLPPGSLLKCPNCAGEGQEHCNYGRRFRTCRKCDGTGVDPARVTYTCWTCKRPQDGKPARTSHSPLSGDFHYCLTCWQPN